MPGDLVIHLDTAILDRQFERLARYSTRGVEAEFDTTCKGIVSDAYLVIPPAQGKNEGLGASASDEANLQRGRRHLLGDLFGIFQPVPIKGRRLITHVFGHLLKNPVYVPTKEVNPDVAAVYRERDSRRHGSRLTRGGRQAFYVDAGKFNAFASTKLSRIGNAASGFTPAARLLGARIPSYARGQSQSGSVILTSDDHHLRFRMDNTVGYASAMPGTQRRLQWVVDNQGRKIERRLPHVIRAAGKDAGFSAT